MRRETAIRTAMVSMLAGLGVSPFAFTGSVKRKYGKCESCGNPTRDERHCFKCKQKHPQATPDLLVLHADDSREAIIFVPAQPSTRFKP